MTSKVLIAGHQYCDDGYSGDGREGCADSGPNSFSEEKQKQWLTNTSKVLTQYKMKWFMTEGNNPSAASNTCMHRDLWFSWLKKLLTDKTCAGFTLWFVSGGGGDPQNNMGGAYIAQGEKNGWDLYSKIYPILPHSATRGQSCSSTPLEECPYYDFSQYV